ncbi:nudC domain-containing protein 3 isoform X2 [Calypte anna]|uniref:nudC domain-containing protein 3 isoform X2 n=1 Tax=Calypte anna TaxID=9244 RepID=UPI0011C40C96|nr:nudC domain-containing protein 3 isoform X2 [Calypte anna]
MEALTDLYDQALLGILQHVGNVEEFLRVLFGFLYRKTDFYRLLLRPGDRLGFPPGAAQTMALQAFRVFERMARQDDEKRQLELEAKLRKKEEEEEATVCAEGVELSPAAQEVEVETTVEAVPAAAAGGAAGTQDSAVAQDAAPSPGLAEPPGATAPAALPTKQEQFQTNPDSYNGAVRENYAWSQDYSDLEIKVPVPQHILKGKQINLNKGDEYWWNAILEGEEQIDIDKINKERSMATVDEEEHAVLDRLTFDYHQKLQGKPQSHELKVHEMLKKGWDTEGSPFRGQKFDPSMFNISPGAVQF